MVPGDTPLDVAAEVERRAAAYGLRPRGDVLDRIRAHPVTFSVRSSAARGVEALVEVHGLNRLQPLLDEIAENPEAFFEPVPCEAP